MASNKWQGTFSKQCVRPASDRREEEKAELIIRSANVNRWWLTGKTDKYKKLEALFSLGPADKAPSITQLAKQALENWLLNPNPNVKPSEIIDVVCLCETFEPDNEFLRRLQGNTFSESRRLANNQNYLIPSWPNYGSYSQPRAGATDSKSGGGLCIYVHEKLPSKKLGYENQNGKKIVLSNDNWEVLPVKVWAKHPPQKPAEVVVVVCYKHPACNADESEAFWSCLDFLIKAELLVDPSANFVIVGDFNEYLLGIKLVRGQDAREFVQHVRKPTRGSAILDLVFTSFRSPSNPTIEVTPTKLQVPAMDHDVLTTRINFP